MRSLIASEDQEQIALIQWANTHPICKEYLSANPNGGSRNIIEAAKLKRMGTRAGVSDLFLAYPHEEYCGLWIELKKRDKKKCKPTKQQIEWLDKMNSVGYRAEVCWGWEEARDSILMYLGMCK